MTMLKTVRRRIIDLKMILQRVGSYVGVLNLGMLMFLFFSSLKSEGYISSIGQYAIPISIISVIVILIIGYFEMYIFKGMYEEQRISYELTDIHPKLEDMKKKIDEMYNGWKK